ncbi:hypothetical protein Tco_0390569 [Tanacetum coccineum]
MDEHLSTRIGFATQTALQSYTTEFEKKSQVEKEKYIVIIEKSVKEIIKDEVKIQLPQISPKEISDFATPVIQSIINESLENIVLAKSSSQPQSTYDAATSLTKDLYDALVKSYQLNKDLFDSYGKAYSLKRGREDKDKDEDPLGRPDQGLKKRKTSKDVEPSRGSKSKESKSSSSKGSKSQSKSSGKSAQAEEPVFNTVGPELPQDQGDDLDQGRQVVLANYFFNKDLEYLKGGSLSNKYTTSITKTKAAKYDTIKGIEDMVPSLWSPVKSLHKFVEGDFSSLNLRDIKDMFLLLVLKKLSNLERHHQEKKHVFPKKHDIKDMFLHRLMRFDELYKFCDCTLSSV